jgi:hypothetical protein
MLPQSVLERRRYADLRYAAGALNGSATTYPAEHRERAGLAGV